METVKVRNIVTGEVRYIRGENSADAIIRNGLSSILWIIEKD